jgi:hypothetical protein
MVLGAATLALIAGSACKTMTPVSLDQLSSLQPDRVWVTDSNRVVEISKPQFVNDTLVGFLNGTYEELPRSEVQQVKMQKTATTRTVLLAVGIAAGVAGFTYAITGGGGEHITNAMAGDCDKHPDDPSCMQ